MALRVPVNPELLAWARERSGIEPEHLSRRFPKLGDWEEGDVAPTLRQLEDFARATRTPIGYLFLAEPPEESLPIPDFRTRRGRGVLRPSPDLLDTLFLCLQRQEWYGDYARATGQAPLAFVGSLNADTPVTEAAAHIREALGFSADARGPTWADALRRLIDLGEQLGVLVMVNGVVGNNTHRKLDPEEFQGFALVDPIAPLVFVNGADTKAAQIFTLTHELAHVWVGQSALSDAVLQAEPDARIERWCNQVAAEVLVPLDLVRRDFNAQQGLTDEIERLARRFKVSTLVILRRLYDADYLTFDAYQEAYAAELERLRQLMAERRGTGGGNFYATQPLRVSRRFARAIVDSTLEGQTLYREAFQMLGFKKISTFNELAAQLRND